MGIGPGSVRNLDIWHESVEIVKGVYALTQSWPKEELYGLPRGICGYDPIPRGRRNQARRAAVSIPANLAEGLGRGSPKEIRRFAQISLGSVYELDTLLYLAADLGFSPQDKGQELQEKLTSLVEQQSAPMRPSSVATRSGSMRLSEPGQW